MIPANLNPTSTQFTSTHRDIESGIDHSAIAKAFSQCEQGFNLHLAASNAGIEKNTPAFNVLKEQVYAYHENALTKFILPNIESGRSAARSISGWGIQPGDPAFEKARKFAESKGDKSLDALLLLSAQKPDERRAPRIGNTHNEPDLTSQEASSENAPPSLTRRASGSTMRSSLMKQAAVALEGGKNFSSPLAQTQSTNPVLEVSQASSVRARKAPGEFLDLADILDPKSLNGKKIGTDYVLLLHRPHSDAVDQIKQAGLKSLARLTAEDKPPEFTEAKTKIAQMFSKFNRFSPDAGLIYFRPVSSNSYPVKKDDFVIAVRPESANVFNQEHRVKKWGTLGGYKHSSMNILEYEALKKSASPGQVVNKFKQIGPYRNDDEMYFPEVCVRTDHIDRSLFVPHSEIDDSLKDKLGW